MDARRRRVHSRFIRTSCRTASHRIRNYGLFAGNGRAATRARRQLLAGRVRALATLRATPRTVRPKALALASMSVLRWPNDHRRKFEGCALSGRIATPDQDRHLMTRQAPRRAKRLSSPPTARWSRKVMSSQGRRFLLQARAPNARPHHSSSKKVPVVFAPTRHGRATRPQKPHQRTVRDPKSP